MRAGIAGVAPRVVTALADRSAQVRWFAAEALAQHGDAQPRDLLLARWNTAAPLDRAGALRALGRMAARAPSSAVTAVLVDAAEHGAPALAAVALDGLVECAAQGDASARGALRVSRCSVAAPRGAGGDRERRRQRPAERSESWRDALRGATRAEDVWLRAEASWQLGRLGASAQPNCGLLADPSAPVAANAAGALATVFSRDSSQQAEEAREALCTALMGRSHAQCGPTRCWRSPPAASGARGCRSGGGCWSRARRGFGPQRRAWRVGRPRRWQRGCARRWINAPTKTPTPGSPRAAETRAPRRRPHRPQRTPRSTRC